MKQVSIKAEVRRGTGTSAMNKIRKQGVIPAILYGLGKEALPLSLGKEEFELTFKRNKFRAIYSINVSDGAKQVVKNTLIKDVQYDPIKTRLTHVDFYEYDEHKKIKTMVPVIAQGTPIGCKTGGILTHIKDQVEVECLPIHIPEHFLVDVSALDVHQAVRVSDLKIPAEVHLHGDPHDILFNVTLPKAEEVPAAATAEGEVAAEGAAGAEGAKEPEVIQTKGKKEEEGAAPAGKKEAPKKEAAAKK